MLAGFASGHVTVDGEELKHLPTIPEPSISQTLDEVWETPKRKKSTTGGAICTKKVKIAQKEP